MSKGQVIASVDGFQVLVIPLKDIVVSMCDGVVASIVLKGDSAIAVQNLVDHGYDVLVPFPVEVDDSNPA